MPKSKRLTNDDLLLQDGLIAYSDPLDGFTKQITIEAAQRIAKVNEDMKRKLQKLGIPLEEEV